VVALPKESDPVTTIAEAAIIILFFLMLMGAFYVGYYVL
jgi:hypothetical protein